ncbi:phosphatidate cytidylyltransferase [Ancylomarina euxinus]|uniref:phosphatidate cytidylyltransferase n=1 Tax=Ancylomarina euxinus TaxID=2283627 RepID=UPI0012E13A6B|nr:phosphatidate cytidylyltransferase [Ancylomarina euxinus]MCZ4693145.1 phosphatidate cytidylyltransferase [Ancylomarina euxinus]
MGEFIKRALTAVLFGIILIAGINLHPVGFIATFLGIALLANYEFYGLIKKANASPQISTGLLAVVLLFAAVTSHIYYGKAIFSHLLLLLVFLSFIIELYRKKDNPFANIAYTLLGIIYVALPFALLIYLVFQNGVEQFRPDIVMGIFIMIWVNDTLAYLVGVNFGKHRLFERISPKKSWEGSIGGGIATLLAALGCSYFSQELSLVLWLSVGLIVAVAGGLGDLVESLFKRSIKVKDSGSILPGHGGILDRFDAILIVAPIVYVFLEIVKEFSK